MYTEEIAKEDEKRLQENNRSMHSYAKSFGRIAQLVELLSYTQAVIGSSPVAPIARVVQLVRAPACHVGSCGFKSRLSRSFISLIFLTPLFLLSACHSNSLEEFREEGREITVELVTTIHQIETREQLIAAAPKLKALFNSMVNAIIATQEYRKKHPEIEVEEISKEEHVLSERLRTELNRILVIEGGKDILEACQQDALHKLDKTQKKPRVT